jgi:hypothetical protein
MKFLGGLFITVLCFCFSSESVWSRPLPNWPPVPMKRPAANTNSPIWHSIIVTPDTRRPTIHFYNKLNPVWWLENADEPVAPDWYLPDDEHRTWKWHFRNPFHNFTFYVIGVADKEIVRSGFYPAENFNPAGGWELAIAQRKCILLPFVSYERPRLKLYFGWRAHGEFGLELKFLHKPKNAPPQN